MPKDFYEVLNVSRTASADEIKKSYRKLSREHHPDVKPNDKQSDAKFKEVQDAYSVIGDPDKRKQYDQFGHAFPQGHGGGQGGFGGGTQFDFGDLFGGAGGAAFDLGDLLGGGGGRRGGSRAQKGGDVQATIQIPFNLAAEGGKHDVTLTVGGNSERLTITIPSGIDHGAVIRLTGQGQPGRGRGARGDLLVTIQVAPHAYFRREGFNLLVDLPLSLTEAALGAKVDVPTLSEGLVTMSVPAGSSSGMKLRLREKGILDSKTNKRGDQFAVLKIVAPKGLDAESRELLEQFATRNPSNPREGLW